jgi:hypothetical protein
VLTETLTVRLKGDQEDRITQAVEELGAKEHVAMVPSYAVQEKNSSLSSRTGRKPAMDD